jgi:hypothetical protein
MQEEQIHSFIMATLAIPAVNAVPQLVDVTLSTGLPNIKPSRFSKMKNRLKKSSPKASPPSSDSSSNSSQTSPKSHQQQKKELPSSNTISPSAAQDVSLDATS